MIAKTAWHDTKISPMCWQDKQPFPQSRSKVTGGQAKVEWTRSPWAAWYVHSAACRGLQPSPDAVEILAPMLGLHALARSSPSLWSSGVAA